MQGKRCHRASRGGWTQARLPAQHVPESLVSLSVSLRELVCVGGGLRLMGHGAGRVAGPGAGWSWGGDRWSSWVQLPVLR